MNTIVGIYKITSPTGKVYIGQSVNIKNRFSHYREVDGAFKKQRKLYSSILKHGYDKHSFEIIHELPKDVRRETFNIYEIMYMDLYKGCGVELLNIKEGGDNGRHTEESKIKIGIGSAKKTFSKETRLKMREASLKRGACLPKGYKHSEATKQKMKDVNRKKPIVTEERRLQLVQLAKDMVLKRKNWVGRKGIPNSPETRLKLSISLKGRKSPMSKKVICSKTGEIFNSIKEAANSINMKHGTLISQMNGASKNKTTFTYFINKT